MRATRTARLESIGIWMRLAGGRCAFSTRTRASMAPGMAEATGPARAGGELVHQLELRARHRHEHELGDALAGLYGERFAPAVPARHHQLALVVGIDQTHQVAEHDPVLVAEPRARQDHRGELRIADVD